MTFAATICDGRGVDHGDRRDPATHHLEDSDHVERSITAVYDRHSYNAEKRAVLDWWDVKLQAILDKNDSARVLPFAR